MTASGRRVRGAPRFGERAALGFAAIFVTAVPFALLTALVETAFSPLEHLDRDVAEDLHDYVVDAPELHRGNARASATPGHPSCGGWS